MLTLTRVLCFLFLVESLDLNYYSSLLLRVIQERLKPINVLKKNYKIVKLAHNIAVLADRYTQ